MTIVSMPHYGPKPEDHHITQHKISVCNKISVCYKILVQFSSNWSVSNINVQHVSKRVPKTTVFGILFASLIKPLKIMKEKGIFSWLLRVFSNYANKNSFWVHLNLYLTSLFTIPHVQCLSITINLDNTQILASLPPRVNDTFIVLDAIQVEGNTRFSIHTQTFSIFNWQKIRSSLFYSSLNIRLPGQDVQLPFPPLPSSHHGVPSLSCVIHPSCWVPL